MCVKSIADALDEGLREGLVLRYRRMRRRGGEEVGYEELSGVGPEDEVGGSKGIGGRLLDGIESGFDWAVSKFRRITDAVPLDENGDANGDVEMAATGTNGTQPISIETNGQTTSSKQNTSIASLIPNFRRRFISSLLSLLLFWTLSSTIFYYTEREQLWTFLDSVYFTFVAFATIGFGDMYPQSSSGLAVFNIFVFVGIAVMTYFASTIALWVRSAHDREGFMREVVRIQEEEDARSRKAKGGETPGEDEDGEEDDGDEGRLVRGAAGVAKSAGELELMRTLGLALGGLRGLGQSASRDVAMASLESLLRDLDRPTRSEPCRGTETPPNGFTDAFSLGPSTATASPLNPRTSAAISRTLPAATARAESPTEYPTLRPPTLFATSTSAPFLAPVDVNTSEDEMGEFQGPVSPRTAGLLAATSPSPLIPPSAGSGRTVEMQERDPFGDVDLDDGGLLPVEPNGAGLLRGEDDLANDVD